MLYYLKKIYWWIIALKISWWFLPYISMNQSQICTCLLPLEFASYLPPHPTEHWVELPVSHSQFLLALCSTYGNIPVSMLLSIHPTLSFPTVSTGLFSMSVSPLLPCNNRFINAIFLDSIHML